MKTAYHITLGTMELEYEGQILLSLRCRPERAQLTPEQLAARTTFTDEVYHQVEAYISGDLTRFTIPYQLLGTPFQKKVWAALQTIPYGTTCSYRELAEKIGNPKACRAVGMANNKNPLMLLIPCHRVIGAAGSLTGYAGGIEMKRFLLALEQNTLASES